MTPAPLGPAVPGSGAISMEGSGHTRTRGLEQKPLCSSGNQCLLLLFLLYEYMKRV